MEKGQTIQRVESRHLCLYQRAIHPELFKIYAVKRVQQARYQAEVWLLGLSHVVTIQIGDQVFTEVITADNEILPKNNLALSFRFRGERDHVQQFPGGVQYILSTQVEKLTPQLFPGTHRDYMHFARSRGMFVTFDQWAHDGLAPFSFIDFDARDHEFHVHAFHAFPEECSLLKTQSIFEIGKRAPIEGPSRW